MSTHSDEPKQFDILRDYLADDVAAMESAGLSAGERREQAIMDVLLRDAMWDQSGDGL